MLIFKNLYFINNMLVLNVQYVCKVFLFYIGCYKKQNDKKKFKLQHSEKQYASQKNDMIFSQYPGK